MAEHGAAPTSPGARTAPPPVRPSSPSAGSPPARGGAAPQWREREIGGSRLHLPHGATAALDSAMWALAVMIVAVLSLTAGIDTRPEGIGVTLTALLAVVLQIVGYLAFLRGRARFATIDEIPSVLLTDVVIAVVLSAFSGLSTGLLLPLRDSILSGGCALTLHLACRWLYLRVVEARQRPVGRRARRTIIMGAGHGGAMAISLMQNDPSSPYTPVALLDDDPAKRHLRLSGVRVLGPWRALAQVSRETNADLVLLAVPSARPEEVDGVVTRARELGLEIRVMPSAEELMGLAPSLAPAPASAIAQRGTGIFRPLELSDLLGRRAIDTDVDAIASYLTGERVLVTGAGGSIGAQLCHEIAKYRPERLILVDRDESALHAVQLSLDGKAMLDSPDLILGDLRTPGFISGLFDEAHPTIVFHAAALKHLTLTERFPEEAFLTNVAATSDLLTAATGHDVRLFINISTDKAADPTSVLGHSKRIAERLTAAVGMSLPAERRFISVRFGNVLGSRGSVLHTFASQLERGLPLTVTDPHMERFFMSINEACQLVLQAGALGRSGEVLVLDMGEPHNIESLARRFATLMGYDEPHVAYTRVRPGEKMTESLFGAGETDRRPWHPLISHVDVAALGLGTLREIDDLRLHSEWGRQGELVRRWMTGMSQAPIPEDASVRPPKEGAAHDRGGAPTGRGAVERTGATT
ncbi:polysaccharide biosynthesis protein [Actinomyces gaoshouyii]|uniref:polysaccharide biosynthesis protein n=1 Tax=Actinomyces gaoshouyii TaxID=1960083 RepID=UPI0009B53687|nr:polysaccharide biosynthesis protein [Actinomyces gaoshouyii]